MLVLISEEGLAFWKRSGETPRQACIYLYNETFWIRHLAGIS